jgi:hypothetical protein
MCSQNVDNRAAGERPGPQMTVLYATACLYANSATKFRIVELLNASVRCDLALRQAFSQAVGSLV